ncbi:MAG: hypothetical protein LBN05_00895 [Oscillospiraceae bacterium]|jgi:hypothetical protein|nr:hypothetical protein [Oscillospiraceae bacterium]
MKRFLTLLLIISLLTGLLVACGEGKDAPSADPSEPTTLSTEEQIAQLLSKKTPTLKEFPAGLMALLPPTPGLTFVGLVPQTQKEPYTCTFHYSFAEAQTLQMYEKDEQNVRSFLSVNALLLLALLGDCARVDIALSPAVQPSAGVTAVALGKPVVYSYDAAWGDKAIGLDVKKAADSAESFTPFVEEVLKLYNELIIAPGDIGVELSVQLTAPTDGQ